MIYRNIEIVYCFYIEEKYIFVNLINVYKKYSKVLRQE